MEFTPTTLFVLPASNTYPTTGTNANLTAGQFGIFLPSNAPATAGNIASAAYIYMSQGRIETIPFPGPLAGTTSMLGTKNSDFIYASDVINWYKIVAHPTATVQITQASDFSSLCGQNISLTLRLDSSYIRTAFYNGLTRTVTLPAVCCDCGSDPCTEVDQQATVDAFVAGVNTDPILSKYVFADRTGTGSSSVLNLTGIPLTSYGTRCDPSAFPYEYDRMDFWTFIYIGPATSMDYMVYDACNQAATVSIIQRASYPRGIDQEIMQMEKDYVSYQTTLKHLFEWDIFNNGFASYVVAGTYYDTYWVQFKEHVNNGWLEADTQVYTVCVAVPTGETSFSTIIDNFLGTPEDKSGSTATTTTSTTTSTTSTSTSTQQFP